MRKRHLLWTVLLVAFHPHCFARADESYYLVMFASAREDIFRVPAHSFATFVKAVDGRVVEVHTISWLPCNPQVGTAFHLHPEPGKNLDLQATFHYVLDQEQKITAWGPYLIKPDLYARAVAQQNRLETGQVRYKAIDTGYRREAVSNCIHAISDLAEESARLRIASPGWGNSASYFVTLQLLPWIIDYHQCHAGIADAIGLGSYPITFRELDVGNPTTGLLLKMVQGARRLGLSRSLSPSKGPS